MIISRCQFLTLAKLLKPYTNFSKKKIFERGSKQKIESRDHQQLILDKLLTYLTEPPIIAYPDFGLFFTPHTDASVAGLRFGPFQIQDDSIRVIGFGSRTKF